MPCTGLISRCAALIKISAPAYWTVGETLILRAKSWSLLIRRVGLLAGKYGNLFFCTLFTSKNLTALGERLWLLTACEKCQQPVTLNISFLHRKVIYMRFTEKIEQFLSIFSKV